MDTYWIPGVNNNGQYGRWAFAEFTDAYGVESGFNILIDSVLNGAGNAVTGLKESLAS